MNIIDERDTRTIYRKLKKKEYDENIQLSASNEQWVRLLDEGMVVDAIGRPLFYIRKHTLRTFYDALPDDYVGSINLGHMDFATFPVLLGQWTKKDLRLVDIGDDREALDVNLRLNEDLSIVKDLRKMNYTLGVSAEFGFHIDEKATKEYGIEVLDAVNIRDFAIVGDAGNVNSSGIQLKGDTMTVQELSAALNNSGAKTLEDVTKLLDAEESKGKEPEAEEPKEEEPKEEPKEEAEEPKAEEPEESKNLATIAAMMETMQKENERLTAEVARLSATIAARDKAEQEFVEKFKNLSVSLSTERVTNDVEESTDIIFTDGIGELT